MRERQSAIPQRSARHGAYLYRMVPAWGKSLVAAVASALMLAAVVSAPGAAAAPVTSTVDVPQHSTVVAQLMRAADYYAPTIPMGTGVRNGWSWSTYMDGDLRLHRTAGNQRYLDQAMAWGRANNWALTTSEQNPDSVKAAQSYFDLNRLDPSASLAAADARMSADLTGLPVRQYWWIDALFMGLPNWARWSARTGNTAYLAKMDALFDSVRNDGLTTVVNCAGRSPGLYDPVERLWLRDCRYNGARDADGQKVFWGRGNGWVIAAMAEVLQALPVGDPHSARYRDMLIGMADRLRGLQGADGMWRTSLLNPTRYPVPETSATALIAYAIAYGVNAGLLDRATYVPVVIRAWAGLTTISLRPGGFVTNCQAVGFEPGTPFTGAGPTTPPTTTSPGSLNAESPPFCVGAFLLAGSEVARMTRAMSTGRPVTASAQQVGNEAPRAVDGDVTTRWSANGFPQALTVDLGQPMVASNTQLVPYLDRAYRYRVEASLDGVSWTTVVDRTTNSVPGTALDNFTPRTLRYARLTVTGVASGVTTWVSIQEFALHDRFDPRPDLALSRPASATSSAAGHASASAVDGQPGATWWASATRPTAGAPQQLTVDLQAVRNVDTVRVTSRPGAGPRAVTVLASTNGTTWTTVASATLLNTEGPHTFLVPVVPARWIRLSVVSAFGGGTVAVGELATYAR